MKTVSNAIANKLKTALPPILFFFVAFNIIGLTQALFLKQYGVDVKSFAVASLLAIAVGRAVVVADKIPFVNKFPDKPLVYNTVWKTCVYLLVAFVFRYAEKLFYAYQEIGSFSGAHSQLVESVSWPRFWAIQIWLLVLFFGYSAAHELINAAGRDKVIKRFFG